MKIINQINSYPQKIILLAMIFYPLFYLGIGTKFPWSLLGENGVGIGMVIYFVATVMFLAVVIFMRPSISDLRLFKIININFILAAIVTIGYDFIHFKHFQSFGYVNPIGLYVLDIIWFGYMFNILNHSKLIQWGPAILFIALHYILSIYYFPNNPLRSDMLFDIQCSLDQFSHGLNPYTKIEPMINVMLYLPGTIISYFPAYWMNIDYRILSLLYWLIGLFLIYFKLKNKPISINHLAVLLIILNPYWLMRHDLYYYVFIIELIIIFLYFPYLNELMRTLVLGVTFATLQFAWIIAPFILFAYSKNIRQLLRQTIFSSILAIGIIVSYTGWSNSDFYKILNIHEYMHPYSGDITFTLATIFYFAKSQELLYLLQVVGCLVIVCIGMVLFFMIKIRETKVYLNLASICYFYFMITNFHTWTYLVIPALLVFSLANLASDEINGNCNDVI